MALYEEWDDGPDWAGSAKPDGVHFLRGDAVPGGVRRCSAEAAAADGAGFPEKLPDDGCRRMARTAASRRFVAAHCRSATKNVPVPERPVWAAVHPEGMRWDCGERCPRSDSRRCVRGMFGFACSLLRFDHSCPP